MRKLYPLLLLLVLSSCSVMQKMGIEKRHYMPGFYVEHSSTPTVERKRIEKECNDAILPIKANLAENTPTIPVKNLLPVTTKKKSAVAINPAPIKPMVTAAQSTTAQQASETTNVPQPYFSNFGDALIWILLVILVLLVAVLFIELFPGLGATLAIVLAVITLILLVLLIKWLISSAHKKAKQTN